MVQLIVGDKGKGKTKCLLDKVNSEVKDILGSAVYIDKSTQHMFELNNKVRLINVNDYFIENTDQFLGFVSGIASQDHDLQRMYFDSFMKIAHLENGSDLKPVIGRLQRLSDAFHIDFTISASVEESDLPEELKALVMMSL